VNAENWNRARHEIRRCVYGGGRKLPGLVKRREAETLHL
jgi:lysozyme